MLIDKLTNFKFYIDNELIDTKKCFALKPYTTELEVPLNGTVPTVR